MGSLKAIQQLLTNSILDSSWNSSNNNNNSNADHLLNYTNNDCNTSSPTKTFKTSFLDHQNPGSDSAEEPSPYMTDKVLRVNKNLNF